MGFSWLKFRSLTPGMQAKPSAKVVSPVTATQWDEFCPGALGKDALMPRREEQALAIQCKMSF